MDLIRMKNVKKVYKTGTTALYDLSLNIEKGEFVFVIGPTGCGKSTLIKMLYREEKPTEGSINVGGIEVSKLKNRKVFKLRRKIGVVFQDYKLLPKLTAYENVAFALEIFGLPQSEIFDKTIKALELVGLKGKAKSYPSELSGGEQQRVAIARAIINSPKLLICDEPTGNLDPEMSREVMKVLDEINKMGTTIVMVTHDITIVEEMKKRTIELDTGRILKDHPVGTFKGVNFRSKGVTSNESA
jgi:cell division transport system ATP-binding protein